MQHTDDEIEKLGIARTWQKMDQASILIQVVDVNSDPDELVRLRNQIHGSSEIKDKQWIVAVNKTDLVSPTLQKQQLDHVARIFHDGQIIIPLSARSGSNLGELETALIQASGALNTDENDVIITNVRHFEALEKSIAAIHRAYNGLQAGMTGDLLAQDIRESVHYLGEITGEITTDEVLGNIFKNFCIRK